MSASTSYQSFLPWQNLPPGPAIQFSPDNRRGDVYFQDDRLRFVAEVAIVTQRPLLLRGEPGSGKSSFAPFVARNLNWRYYEHTVTGATEARDLLWHFDALRRLRDAQAQSGVTREELAAERYLAPGVLWWAFNRRQALQFSAAIPRRANNQVSSLEPFAEVNENRDPLRAVVLIDEIDKADPNVPNDLLEVLGSNRFRVEEVNHLVDREPASPDGKPANQYGSLLTVITTNEERDLPAAFLRRCVVHKLAEPEDRKQQVDRLKSIAELQMNRLITGNKNGTEIVAQVAEKCIQLREDARRRQRRGPSIAEFLDAVRFCLTRGIQTSDDLWKAVQESVLLK